MICHLCARVQYKANKSQCKFKETVPNIATAFLIHRLTEETRIHVMIMTCIVTTHATKNTLTHGNRAMRVVSPGSDRIKLPPFLPQDHCGLLFLRRALRKTNQALWDKGVWQFETLLNFFFPARQYSNDFFGCQHSSYWRLTYLPYWSSLLLCRFNCACVRVLRLGINVEG